MDLKGAGPRSVGARSNDLSTIDQPPASPMFRAVNDVRAQPTASEFEMAEQLIPEKELTFHDDEANSVYLEHLKKKEQIRDNLEALSRESSFLRQLNPDQYAYMYQK